MKVWTRTAGGLEADLGPTTAEPTLWLKFLWMCGGGLIGASMADVLHIWGSWWVAAMMLGAMTGAGTVGLPLFNSVVGATVRLEGATVLVDVQRLFRSRFRLARTQIRAVRLVGTRVELVCREGAVRIPLAHRSDQERREVLSMLRRFVEGAELDAVDQVPSALVGLIQRT